jgi:hypothetical protein
VNKKKFILFPLLAMFLTSCLFDADDDGLSSWLSDQGMPSSYKVQTVSINDLKPVSAEVFVDTLPKNARTRGVLGTVSGMTHDVVVDFGVDSAFLARLKSAKSAKAFLKLQLVDSYYLSEFLPSGILPIEEEVKFDVSWIISEKLNKNGFNGIASIKDSVWFHDLESWEPQKSDETSLSVSMDKKDTVLNGKKQTILVDSILNIEMPESLVNDLGKNPGNRRLQLRLSAPEASHVYRFYGPSSTVPPRFRLELDNENGDYVDYKAVHAATISSNREECSDCLVLHSGIYDSLVVEFPSKPIMKALSDFYGDEFPYSGEGDDVRQAVVMAQVTFYKDDSKGAQELEYPILVAAGSYQDSAGVSVRRMENYKMDKQRILESGHPNMVFHEGDSISLQVTAGMRDFINRAQDGRTFKMMMRLDHSVLLDKDTVFSERASVGGDTLMLANGDTVEIDNGETIFVTFPYFDYARYDFTSIKNKPATLKLWLASKRGEE